MTVLCGRSQGLVATCLVATCLDIHGIPRQDFHFREIDIAADMSQFLIIFNRCIVLCIAFMPDRLSAWFWGVNLVWFRLSGLLAALDELHCITSVDDKKMETLSGWSPILYLSFPCI